MRGICYMQLGQYEKAIEFYKKHIIKEKELSGLEYMESHVFLFQAICHYELKDYEAAMDLINTGISIDNRTADLYYWLAKIEMARKNYNEARVAIDEARRLFKMGNFNSRVYVEEFYQTYIEDISELSKTLERTLLNQ